MSPAKSTWKYVVLLGFVVIAGYFMFPQIAAKDALYEIIGVGSVICVAVGIRLQHPANRNAWMAIGAGNLSFVLGDGVYDMYQFILHRPTPFPSLADGFYLAGYPFLIFGVASLTRGHRRTGRARESIADATIISIGAMAISWHFLMGSYAHDPTIGSFGKLVNLSYPVLDLGIVFIVFQGLIFGTARRAVHGLIAISMVAMVVADFAYDILVLHGSYQVGNPIDVGWLLNYVLIGAAALHPSMAYRIADETPSEDELKRRLPIVALAGLTAPAILLVGALSRHHNDVGPLALFSTIVFALVVIRRWWMLDRISEQSSALEEALLIKDTLEEELRHRASHDSLTGLANRELLQERVQLALTAASRDESNIAMCFCDLDNFKTINDSLGHAIGDAMLVLVAKQLVEAVRPEDLVARLSGDEFAIFMEGLEDPAAAITIAERIVGVLREPIVVEGREIALSVSVGVAVARQDTTTEELLSEADSAMYAAKAAGRDRYEIFQESMLERSLERLEITNSFKGALTRGEFLLEYQPQYSLADGQLEGFEALLRWQHPRLGLLEPMRFIAIAEETGQIVPIGRWVIKEACMQAKLWSHQCGYPLSISVNLSGRQLGDPSLIDDALNSITTGEINPDQLILEVTENALATDPTRAESVLNTLKSAGLRLAIDDFGLSYSSLTYLRRFPIDLLKIDKSFVDPLVDPSGEGEAFISTIVSLARNLGLQTVAEGVEHDIQKTQLHRLGCDSAMGYLMSPPLRSEGATPIVLGARSE